MSLLDDEFETAYKIRKNIAKPRIPARVFHLHDFPGSGAGSADFNFIASINRAIDACSLSGGGKVVIPTGHYDARGPILLKSMVEIHFEAGTSILFSDDRNDYLVGLEEHQYCVLTSFEGSMCYNYSPLIYASSCHDIAVTGDCVMDANGERTWLPMREHQASDRSDLHDCNNRAVPVEERVYGKGHHLRVPFIFFHQCSRVMLEGLRLFNAGFWMVHPILCSDVTFSSLHLESHSINSDGIDPESCENVHISDCTFQLGDDNIAIKSGRDLDGLTRNTPSRNIFIEKCRFAGLNGFSIGSEVSGGADHIYIENCLAPGPLVNGILIKTNRNRGGSINNIFVRNLWFASCHTGIKIDMNYKRQNDFNRTPSVTNLAFENIDFEEIKDLPAVIRGLPESKVGNILFSKVRYAGTDRSPDIQNAGDYVFEKKWKN